MGDIVVRPVDESVLAVQQAGAKGIETLVVQVYGTGVMTELHDPGNVLRPKTAIQTDSDRTYYPIGPWEHFDTH